jgi:hypothetical protein
MSHRCEYGKDSDVCVKCHEEFHVPLETGNGRGRPPIAGETATGQIQLRTTMTRKNAYVRAAKPKKLTAWIFEHLDKAANYTPDHEV